MMRFLSSIHPASIAPTQSISGESFATTVAVSRWMAHGMAIALTATTFSISSAIAQPAALAVPTDRFQVAQATPTQPGTAMIFFVDPGLGSDAGDGSQRSPFRSITQAIQSVPPNSVLILSAGTYSVETGEAFPIRLPNGMTLQGNPGQRGRGIVIRGGGMWNSPSAGTQNITLIGNSGGLITGVTLTNPNTDGIGLWIESANPAVANNTISGNGGDGVWIVGNSAPLLTGNQIIENRDGVVVRDVARPVLRQNIIAQNERDGVVAIAQSRPDLGTSTQPGQNVLQQNGQFQIYASTQEPILAIGNQLDTQRLAGRVDLTGTLVASQPSSTPIPMVTFGSPFTSSLSAQSPVAAAPPASGFLPSTPMLATTPATVPASPATPSASSFPRPTQPNSGFVGNPSPQFMSLQVQPTSPAPVSAPIPAIIPVTTPTPAPVVTAPAPVSIPVVLPLAASPNTLVAAAESPGAIAIPVPEPLSTRTSAAIAPSSSRATTPAPAPVVQIPVTPAPSPPPVPVAVAPTPTPSPAPRTSAPPLPSDILPVPDPNAPIGNIGSLPTVQVSRYAQAGGSGASPRAAALGLRYRVLVDAPNERTQDAVRSLIPDAFRTTVNGRTMMQAGAYGDRVNADEVVQLLNQYGFEAIVQSMD